MQNRLLDLLRQHPKWGRITFTGALGWLVWFLLGDAIASSINDAIGLPALLKPIIGAAGSSIMVTVLAMALSCMLALALVAGVVFCDRVLWQQQFPVQSGLRADELAATGVVGAAMNYTPSELEYLMEATREMLNYVGKDVGSLVQELQTLNRDWLAVVNNGGVGALRENLSKVRTKIVACSSTIHEMPRRDKAFKAELVPLLEGNAPHIIRDGVAVLNDRLAIFESVAPTPAVSAIVSDMDRFSLQVDGLNQWVGNALSRIETERAKFRARIKSE